MKKYKKIGSLIGCTILACGVITSAPFIVTACGRTLKDLSLIAVTNNPNQSNHGELDNGEISLNTYDNNDLHISTARNIGNADLQWQWSDTIDGDYTNIDSAIGNTGLFIDKTVKDKISISATQSNRNQFTFKDFYVRANIKNKLLSSEPILIHFHNAPEILSASGIITGTTTNITNFAPSNVLLQYDTIYIPEEIQTINSGIFSDKFNGSDNYCQNIQNIIFADRDDKTCDVGMFAFSSNSDLVLKGNVYIGSGEYVCDGGANMQLAIFFSVWRYNSGDASIEMGDVVINGDCRISSTSTGAGYSSLFSAFSDGGNSSIKMGGITINGDCNCSSSGSGSSGGYSDFFSASAPRGNDASIEMGDVTISGDCISNASNGSPTSLFFSSNSKLSSSIITGNVTISGDCSINNTGVVGVINSSFFSSVDSSLNSSSILIANVKFANEVTIIITGAGGFLYAPDGDSSLKSLQFDETILFKTDSSTPLHGNFSNITKWPYWTAL